MMGVPIKVTCVAGPPVELSYECGGCKQSLYGQTMTTYLSMLLVCTLKDVSLPFWDNFFVTILCES